jgi:TolB-like protein
LTIQLISGKEGHHLWSTQYDREIQKVEDLIDIQSEVAQLVAAEIEAIIIILPISCTKGVVF